MTGAPIADVRARSGEEDDHRAANRRMFDRIAPTYDVANRVLSAGIDRAWRARAVSAVANAPRGRMLDLCAGTMDLSALLARARPSDPLAAVDFSAPMLEAGRHKAPRAEIVVADAASLPFDDASFAGVVCGFGMRNLADVARAVREVRRVLAPGGVFVTLEFFRPARWSSRVFHGAYARYVLPTVGGLLSGDPGAYRYLSESMAGFFTRREYEGLLASAGLASVSGIDLTLGIASIVRAEARR